MRATEVMFLWLTFAGWPLFALLPGGGGVIWSVVWGALGHGRRD